MLRRGPKPTNYNNPELAEMNDNKVTLNGESRTFPPRTTLLDIVHLLNLEPDRVAIELDRLIVKRELWSGAVVADGAEIEIVQFVGGG